MDLRDCISSCSFCRTRKHRQTIEIKWTSGYCCIFILSSFRYMNQYLFMRQCKRSMLTTWCWNSTVWDCIFSVILFCSFRRVLSHVIDRHLLSYRLLASFFMSLHSIQLNSNFSRGRTKWLLELEKKQDSIDTICFRSIFRMRHEIWWRWRQKKNKK